MRIRMTGGFVAFSIALVSGVSAALATSIVVAPQVKTAEVTKLGIVLVDGNGSTLYRFTRDKRGKPGTCSGGCTASWPPVIAPAGVKVLGGKGAAAAKLGTVRRSTGQLQVTYGGYPLYRYAEDKRAGQAKGEGKEGVWFAVAPSGALVKTPQAQTPPAAAATSPTPVSPAAPAPNAPPADDGMGGSGY